MGHLEPNTRISTTWCWWYSSWHPEVYLCHPGQGRVRATIVMSSPGLVALLSLGSLIHDPSPVTHLRRLHLDRAVTCPRSLKDGPFLMRRGDSRPALTRVCVKYEGVARAGQNRLRNLYFVPGFTSASRKLAHFHSLTPSCLLFPLESTMPTSCVISLVNTSPTDTHV
ncbi:hypothetical protein BJ322DRAFT_714384 [Thelephora terrestris]|uniref:Uncharacterized protein n=1 Tax=Thelephora terrestris TaxID=56493 RepID=A0A9P6L8Z3_9AGAM|nr:hypothetical protein BJ322DRAFT_714384 [Thelephora terrestris]